MLKLSTKCCHVENVLFKLLAKVALFRIYWFI